MACRLPAVTVQVPFAASGAGEAELHGGCGFFYPGHLSCSGSWRWQVQQCGRSSGADIIQLIIRGRDGDAHFLEILEYPHHDDAEIDRSPHFIVEQIPRLVSSERFVALYGLFFPGSAFKLWVSLSFLSI